jgi:uncharacterized protein (DUF433 family)/predicted nuclease of predicted toxin-antitoxin system
MKVFEKIEVDENILHGEPHITGTRVPVKLVLSLLSEGLTPEEIIKEHYPVLKKEDILSCIKYLTQILEEEEIHYVKSWLMPVFFIDECVSIQTEKFLKNLKYKTVNVKDHKSSGASDNELFRLAKEEGYVLVTYDKGFGNIIEYPPSSHNGIILLKVRNKSSMEKCHKVLQKLLSREKELKSTLFVIDEKKYRKRQKP